MPRILVVRGPEADFRPERWIVDQVVAALRTQTDLEIKDIQLTADFQQLDDQKLFYDDKTMFENYSKTLEVMRDVQEGDVIFLGDAWNPVIPALRFYAFTVFGRSDAIKIAGIFHSSVETEGDFFYESGAWGRQMEAAVVAALDYVFVATPYGIKTVMENSSVSAKDRDKIKADGLPLTASLLNPKYANIPKTPDTFVFAHRWAEDKRPDMFTELCAEYREQFTPEARFIVLHPSPISSTCPYYENAVSAGVEFKFCGDRESYLNEISKAEVVVSTATLETFGYAIIEGVQTGAMPFVPNKACYPYMYKPEYIFNDAADVSEIAKSLRTALTNHRANNPSGEGKRFLDSLLPDMRRTVHNSQHIIAARLIDLTEDL